MKAPVYVPKDLQAWTVPKSSVLKIVEMENVTSPLVNATILFVPLDLKARPARAKSVVASALMVLGIARPENAFAMPVGLALQIAQWKLR